MANRRRRGADAASGFSLRALAVALFPGGIDRGAWTASQHAPGGGRFITAARTLLLLLALLVATAGGHAAATDFQKKTGGLTVNLGVVPAELVRSHSRVASSGAMHGGVPARKNSHHIIVSIFDKIDQRVDDAEVFATVKDLGISETRKKLETMEIANAITYGNYFQMPGKGPYIIEVEIRRRDHPPVRVAFNYSNPK